MHKLQLRKPLSDLLLEKQFVKNKQTNTEYHSHSIAFYYFFFNFNVFQLTLLINLERTL